MTPRRAVLLAFAVCGAVWVALVGAALRYPLGNDPAIFQFHAWAMGEGVVPYRDTFDLNTPGIILVHWVWGAVAGFDDSAWLGLVMGLSTLALCGVAVGPGLRRRVSTPAVLVGVAAGIWAFVVITPWDRGQRELLQGVLHLAAFGAGARAARAGSTRRAVLSAGLAGLLGGAVVTIKITGAAVVWLCWAGWLFELFREQRLAGRPGLRRALWASGASMVGLALPVIGVLVWLYAVGAWEAFWATQLTYLPLHGTLLTVPWTEAMQDRLPIVLGLLGLASLVVGRRGGPLRVLGLVHLGALTLYLGQQHGWTYHLHIAIPLVAPTVALLVARVPPLRRELPAVALAAVPLALAALTTIYDHGPGLVRGDHVDDHWSHPAHIAVADWLQTYGHPTDRVLTNADEHQLLLYARRRPATPFLYGFYCSESHAEPALQKLAMIRLQMVTLDPPEWVVWNTASYSPELDGLHANPLLRAWIMSHCAEVFEAAEEPYRVWRCVPASTPGRTR